MKPNETYWELLTMPIYEYVCDDCGTKFEKLVRRNGDGIACPSCGQAHLTTALSTFAAHSNGKAKTSELPSCPGGMCQTPDICGRN
jgi:putative FmdB family regulatory protein